MKMMKDMAIIVENCQRHKHTRTCYKYDPSECRFGLDPSHHVPETYMDMESGELTYRISDGMVNAYNPTMIQSLRCNMDVKFIGSGGSAKAILYYITDYITKTPLKAHVAYTALKVAKEKAEKTDRKSVV